MLPVKITTAGCRLPLFSLSLLILTTELRPALAAPIPGFARVTVYNNTGCFGGGQVAQFDYSWNSCGPIPAVLADAAGVPRSRRLFVNCSSNNPIVLNTGSLKVCNNPQCSVCPATAVTGPVLSTKGCTADINGRASARVQCTVEDRLPSPQPSPLVPSQPPALPSQMPVVPGRCVADVTFKPQNPVTPCPVTRFNNTVTVSPGTCARVPVFLQIRSPAPSPSPSPTFTVLSFTVSCNATCGGGTIQFCPGSPSCQGTCNQPLPFVNNVCVSPAVPGVLDLVAVCRRQPIAGQLPIVSFLPIVQGGG